MIHISTSPSCQNPAPAASINPSLVVLQQQHISDDAAGRFLFICFTVGEQAVHGPNLQLAHPSRKYLVRSAFGSRRGADAHDFVQGLLYLATGLGILCCDVLRKPLENVHFVGTNMVDEWK